jgi:hypothetical protein
MEKEGKAKAPRGEDAQWPVMCYLEGRTETKRHVAIGS